MSDVLAFSRFYDDDALKVSRGDEIRIWYGEDLLNHTEQDNDGVTCMMAQAYIARK